MQTSKIIYKIPIVGQIVSIIESKRNIKKNEKEIEKLRTQHLLLDLELWYLDQQTQMEQRIRRLS